MSNTTVLVGLNILVNLEIHRCASPPRPLSLKRRDSILFNHQIVTELSKKVPVIQLEIESFIILANKC